MHFPKKWKLIASLTPISTSPFFSRFDTYRSKDESRRLAKYVEAVQTGLILAMVVNDEGSNNLEDFAKKSLVRLGSQQITTLGFRWVPDYHSRVSNSSVTCDGNWHSQQWEMNRSASSSLSAPIVHVEVFRSHCVRKENVFSKLPALQCPFIDCCELMSQCYNLRWVTVYSCIFLMKPCSSWEAWVLKIFH